MKVVSAFKRASAAFRTNGIAGLRSAWWNYRHRTAQDRAYRRWIETSEAAAKDPKKLTHELAQLKTQPLISVLLPVYNIDERWLRRCIESVTAQIYPNWELCIADDASSLRHVRAVLDEYAAENERIRVTYRTENGHISAASNSALELASGEFVVLLDHDDELSRDALLRVALEIDAFPETGLIYSDEDLIDESGRRFAPKFKPDFSRDLLYSLNLVTHLSAFRTEIVREIGGFRPGFEGSQDYDLALRVVEKLEERQIRHIPHILYHWRVIPGSVALSMEEKPYAHERARRAIREHFVRTGVEAHVSESFHKLHRVSYTWSTEPTIEMIETRDGDTERLVRDVSASMADVLVFRGDGCLFVDPDSAHELARFAMQPGIGIVAGRVVTENQKVNEAGFVFEADLSIGLAHHRYPANTPGNIVRNQQVGNYSAVSLRCTAIRRELLNQVGGIDSGFASLDLLAADLCLRLRDLNKRIVVAPHVEVRTSGRSRAATSDKELERFRQRWSSRFAYDPFCNPNLKRDGSFDIDV